MLTSFKDFTQIFVKLNFFKVYLVKILNDSILRDLVVEVFFSNLDI